MWVGSGETVTLGKYFLMLLSLGGGATKKKGRGKKWYGTTKWVLNTSFGVAAAGGLGVIFLAKQFSAFGRHGGKCWENCQIL